jgi:hypothetical protein
MKIADVLGQGPDAANFQRTNQPTNCDVPDFAIAVKTR